MVLHSNTDASSFKLQPAPRPKFKKRPQNPLPFHAPASPKASLSALNPETTRVSTERSSSDSCSPRACLESDEDVLTPKASMTKLPSRTEKDSLDGSMISQRGSRASTKSLTSAASIRSSNSVTRLLAAMSLSTSPRRSITVVPSEPPSATLTVMLTNKSPTPSSPLFPRRTLMRSLSSTCLNKSPTSPVLRSPSAALRKRMGWRGALATRMHHETAILMSPGSPLTPRRAEALHTPTQASIASVLDSTTTTTNNNNNNNNNNLPPYEEEDQIEPLSATLRALGAKRRTERFASTCIPVQSPILESPEAFDTLHQIKSPSSEAETTANQEQFELVTAERKIFHLPTWVRFEANHHARSHIAEENRKAAAEFSQLQIASLKAKSTAQQLERKPVVMKGEAWPKTSHLGDVAPDSPNGELFSGFDIVTPPSVCQQAEEGEYVVSVVRRPTMATLRESDGRKKNNNGARVLDAILSALPPFRPSYRIKGSTATVSSPVKKSDDDKERRDGWGGVLTRSSWFPNHAKGPLVSPSSIASKKQSAKSGLKRIVLQPSSLRLGAKYAVDDEWEDVPQASSAHAEIQPRSFLELNDAPRFFNRPPAASTSRRWFPSRNQTTPLPAQKVNPLEIHKFNTLPTKPLKDETISSDLITKSSNTSIENRPHPTIDKMVSNKLRVTVIVITATLIAVIVTNAVLLTHAAQKFPSHSQGANTVVQELPTATGTGTGTGAGTNGTDGVVQKAAQMSQPWF
ncbi:uncharacterized protein UTRI_04581 [Ustilago trichophora]|uniref:Uncharacterized protein n=1 Tax=Ustilago trichophora TaxID=86804 RepID=A0A5C3EDM2_9BASI|nr:uncharacterized protein UTRI_04581 [Ustilago trichophora]